MHEENKAILDKLLYALPVFQRILDDEIGIGLTDREKFLLYQPSKNLKLNAVIGKKLEPGTGLYRAVHENLPRISVRIDNSSEGIPYTATAGAVYNEHGEIIGAISLTRSVERQDAMHKMAGSLLNNISMLASTAEEITAQSQEISSITRELAKIAEESEARVQETNRVLSFIKEIAGQTNLLGLNAAIEAARVGEQGRGFGVVADEIRKLAVSSTESISKITAIIGAIQSDSMANSNQISQVEQGISQVADAISHMAEVVQELRSMAQDVDDIAEQINAGVS